MKPVNQALYRNPNILEKYKDKQKEHQNWKTKIGN